MTNQSSTVKLLGIEIDSQPLGALIKEAESAVDGTQSQIAFACANPHSLAVSRNDELFQQALMSADQVVADGVGLVVGARLAHIEIEQRITGADYFFSLMERMNQNNKRVFFLGSTEKVLSRIKSRAEKDYPGLEAIGTLSPPFGNWSAEENQALIDQINEFKPDVIWVGMTAPKQEKWIHANRHKLNVAVLGAVGAVFDFYAGTHPRAPGWIHSNGLEWLYRLVREPRRMWRRNFVSGPVFLWMIVQERLRSQKTPPASAYYK